MNCKPQTPNDAIVEQVAFGLPLNEKRIFCSIGQRQKEKSTKANSASPVAAAKRRRLEKGNNG